MSWRPISSTYLKPAVVISAVGGVFPSRMALVAVVVPWNTRRMSGGVRPACASTLRMAVMKPPDRSPGVEGVFATQVAPVPASAKVISVKVPPTSMAIVPVSGMPAIVDETERHPIGVTIVFVPMRARRCQRAGRTAAGGGARASARPWATAGLGPSGRQRAGGRAEPAYPSLGMGRRARARYPEAWDVSRPCIVLVKIERRLWFFPDQELGASTTAARDPADLIEITMAPFMLCTFLGGLRSCGAAVGSRRLWASLARAVQARRECGSVCGGGPLWVWVSSCEPTVSIERRKHP